MIALDSSLTQNQLDDSLFLRKRLVGLISESIREHPDLTSFLPKVLDDKSVYVRQALAKGLYYFANLEWKAFNDYFEALCIKDPAHEVRAQMILSFSKLINVPEKREMVLGFLVNILESEQHAFVLRVALKAVYDGYIDLQAKDISFAAIWWQTLSPVVNTLYETASDVRIRRYCAQAREQVWCASNPDANTLKYKLVDIIQATRRGKASKLPREWLHSYDETLLGRVMSVLSQADFGLEVVKRFSRIQLVRSYCQKWCMTLGGLSC